MKQPELIEESRMFWRCHIVQRDTQQPRGPVKVAPPDRMPRVRRDAGIKHMTNFGLLLEQVDELQSVALMELEAHLKRAQSAMHAVAIVGANAGLPVTCRTLQPTEDVSIRRGHSATNDVGMSRKLLCRCRDR